MAAKELLAKLGEAAVKWQRVRALPVALMRRACISRSCSDAGAGRRRGRTAACAAAAAHRLRCRLLAASACNTWHRCDLCAQVGNGSWRKPLISAKNLARLRRETLVEGGCAGRVGSQCWSRMAGRWAGLGVQGTRAMP